MASSKYLKARSRRLPEKNAGLVHTEMFLELYSGQSSKVLPRSSGALCTSYRAQFAVGIQHSSGNGLRSAPSRIPYVHSQLTVS